MIEHKEAIVTLLILAIFGIPLGVVIAGFVWQEVSEWRGRWLEKKIRDWVRR